MKSLALACLAAAAMVAVVSGQTYIHSACPAMGSTFELGKCYNHNFGQSNTAVTFTMTLSQAQYDSIPMNSQGKRLLTAMLWNPDRSVNGWGSAQSGTFQIIPPSSDYSQTNPAATTLGTHVQGYDSSGTVINMMTKSTNVPACVGVYTLKITWDVSTTLNTLIMVFPTPANDPINIVVGDTYSGTNQWFPGDTITMNVLDSWSTVGYPLQKFSWQVTSSIAQADDVAWTASSIQSSGGGGSLNVGNSIGITQDAGNQNMVSFATDKAVKGPGNGATAQYTIPVPQSKTNGGGLYPKQYDWSTQGPFINLQTSIVSAQPFPSLPATGQNVNNANAPTYQVYMMKLPFTYLNYKVTFSNVVDSAGSGTRPNGDLGLFFASATSLNGADPTSSGSYTQGIPGQPNWNSDFWQTGQGGGAPGAPTGANTKYLSPYDYTTKFQPIVFVFVNRGSCNGYKLTFDVAWEQQNLQGECMSYADCNFASGDSGDHPSKEREKYSANDDSERFRHCVLRSIPQNGVPVPTTQCVECMRNCDCAAGQYCLTQDTGMSYVNGYAWISDAWTSARYGLCVEKSSHVLGSYCRTDMAAELTNTDTSLSVGPYTPQQTSQASNMLVLAETEQDQSADAEINEDITGYGFCGEARYYNNSGLGNGDDWKMQQPEFVRTVLWSGFCYNQVCMECMPVPTAVAPGSEPGCPMRSCINGRYLDNVYVDFTKRTFHQNTVAGTTLAAAIFLIILNLMSCLLAGMLYKRQEPSSPGNKEGLMRTNPVGQV